MNDRQESKRIDLAREPVFRLGTAEVVPATREFLVGDSREVLEPRIMQVLVALARRRGEVVSREELSECCWNGRIVGDDAVSRCITAVRKLASAYGGFSLETIPRVGYRLIEETAPPSDVPPLEEAKAPAGASGTWIRRRWKMLLVGVGALLVIVVAISPMLRPRPYVRPDPSRLTIAVLPFTPLYGGADGQQLGDAITFSVADALTGSPWDVVSPAKSLQYRGAAKAGAAQALHADFLIDGDVRRGRDKLIVALRVIEGSTGTVLVAMSIERTLAEAAGLPDDVALQIAQLGTAAKGAKHASGWNPRVMAGYFRAMFQYAGRNDMYGANETARTIAKSAPKDAFAQFVHGFTATALIAALPSGRRPEMVAEARQAAERAIGLDSSFADPYAVLALTTPYYDWTTRERHLRHGLAVFSQSLAVQVQMIELLQNAGRFRESASLADAGFRSAPYQVRSLIELINARLWSGDVEGSRVLIDRGRQLYQDKSPWFVAKMFEANAFHGDTAATLMLLRDETVQKYILVPDGSLKTYQKIALALIHRRASDIDAVVGDCRKLEGRSPEVKRTCFMALVVLLRLDDAFAAALVLYPDQRAATAEARQRKWLSTEISPTAYLSIPITAPLRADPRYRDLVERVGLLQYWQSSHSPPDFCATEKVPVCRLLN